MWRATGADGAGFARLQWPRAHIRARYMMVALLDSAILRNLHLGRTAELAKHATNNEKMGLFCCLDAQNGLTFTGQPASVFRRFPLAARLAEFGRLSIPPAVAPIRDRAAAFQTNRTEPRRMLSCWSLRCQLSHANLINV
jgi:hypothetical protein